MARAFLDHLVATLEVLHVGLLRGIARFDGMVVLVLAGQLALGIGISMPFFESIWAR